MHQVPSAWLRSLPPALRTFCLRPRELPRRCTICSTLLVRQAGGGFNLTMVCSLPVALSFAPTLQNTVGVDIEGRLQSAAYRAVPAGCLRQVEAGPTTCCCWTPAYARPAAHVPSRQSGCRPRWRTPATSLVGIVVFFSINGVITPPMVSIPRVNGVTSSNSTSVTSPLKYRHPESLHPWQPLHPGSRPCAASLPKNSVTTLGLHHRHTGLATNQNHVSRYRRFLQARISQCGFARLEGTRLPVLPTRDSSLARVTFTTRCLGPVLSAVMYGRFTSVCSAAGKLNLGFLGRFFQALHGQR